MLACLAAACLSEQLAQPCCPRIGPLAPRRLRSCLTTATNLPASHPATRVVGVDQRAQEPREATTQRRGGRGRCCRRPRWPRLRLWRSRRRQECFRVRRRRRDSCAPRQAPTPRRATLVAKARDLRSSLCVPRVRYRHIYTQAGTTSATMGFGGPSLRGHTCQAAVGDGAHRISAPISPCKCASTAAQFGRRAASLGQHRAGEAQERGGGSRARKVRPCAHVYARTGRKVGRGRARGFATVLVPRRAVNTTWVPAGPGSTVNA